MKNYYITARAVGSDKEIFLFNDEWSYGRSDRPKMISSADFNMIRDHLIIPKNVITKWGDDVYLDSTITSLLPKVEINNGYATAVIEFYELDFTKKIFNCVDRFVIYYRPTGDVYYRVDHSKNGGSETIIDFEYEPDQLPEVAYLQLVEKNSPDFVPLIKKWFREGKSLAEVKAMFGQVDNLK